MWLHWRAAHLLLLVSVLGTPLLARGQACTVLPQPVLDTNGNPFPNPDNLVDVQGTLFLTVEDPTQGTTLWKTDGTRAGTVRVRPVPGWESTATLSHFTAVGQQLFFAVSTTTVPAHDELWASDGTNRGTDSVATFAFGGLGLESEFVPLGNELLFSADDGSSGFELWSSKGLSGATRVQDLWQGVMGSHPTSLTVMNGQLFFVASDGKTGNELWKRTGPTEETQVKDIRQGPPDSLATSLTVMGGMLYFIALDEDTGNLTLWKSNGTNVTEKVAPSALADATGFSNLTAVGDKLFFLSTTFAFGEELWVTDGTEAGTHLVKDIRPGGNDSEADNLVAVGDTLFFVANDGTNGPEPWRSDGTGAGTQLVRDFYLGPTTPPVSAPELVAGPGVLVAQITDNTWGSELWKLDATGATRLTDIAPGAASSAPSHMTLSGDKLYFAATDPSLGNVLYMLPLNQVDCSPPILKCPDEQILEATSPSGAFYESLPYQVSDDALVEPEVLGKERLKGWFPIGTTTTIPLQAKDAAGNPSPSCDVRITVKDTSPPYLMCPEGTVVQESTGPDMRPYFFALASDATVVDLKPDYHGHEPGTVFPLGPTPVHVTASDGWNPPSECDFTIDIQDTVPPRITCPQHIDRVAKTADDLTVDYRSMVHVEDVGSPTIEPVAEPSGNTFPVGNTEVTLTAEDAAHRTGSCKFTVSIRDEDPPTITCPEPMQVAASEPDGAVVNFTPVVDDNLGADMVEVKYSQEPGTLFPVGVTLVTATAMDQGNHSVSCTFPVTVSAYVVSDGSCQAAGSGGALGWLLVVLLPVWARRRAAGGAR